MFRKDRSARIFLGGHIKKYAAQAPRLLKMMYNVHVCHSLYTAATQISKKLPRQITLSHASCMYSVTYNLGGFTFTQILNNIGTKIVSRYWFLLEQFLPAI